MTRMSRMIRVSRMTRVTRMTRVNRMTWVTRVTRMTRVSRMTKMTWVARVTGMTRVTRVTWVTTMTMVTLVARLTRMTTVPFKSKLTVHCKSRFSIPARIKNRESRTNYGESSRGSSLAGQKTKDSPMADFSIILYGCKPVTQRSMVPITRSFSI